jgi:hypothetical protein
MHIKVVTGHDGECVWRDLLEANLKEYCSRWDYDLVTKFDGWKPTVRHVFWRKLELIQQEFTDCDWLLWLDADCFVMNMTTPLARYVDDTFDLGITGPFVSTCPHPECPERFNDVFSAGILLIRQCQWSRNILKEWWASEDTTWRPPGCNNGWMGDTAYLTCRLMQQPAQREHIKVFPLEEIGWATIANKPSQFIAHCYGSSGPQRRERFEHYEQNTVR